MGFLAHTVFQPVKTCGNQKLEISIESGAKPGGQQANQRWRGSVGEITGNFP